MLTTSTLRTGLRRRTWAWAACFLALLTASPRASEAERGASAEAAPAADDRSCARCHVSSAPGRSDATLLPCPRADEAAVTLGFGLSRGPRGVILLDALSGPAAEASRDDQFGPVPFDHGTHADWAALVEGCTLCHHFTPQGSEHPACRDCHLQGEPKPDLAKPGLKGAYHRQCLGCHRDWSHETRCGACHLPRAEQPADAGADRRVTRDDAVGRMHPPIPAPERVVHVTDYPDRQASVVYFEHERHVESYGARCIDCHRGESCLRCHDYRRSRRELRTVVAWDHVPCDRCHQVQRDCETCHLEPDAPPPAPFDHESTGWSLEPYHGEQPCRACHGSTPYKARSPQCTACHASARGGEVVHGALTGLELDRNHAEEDCAECHEAGDYGVPPRCDGCHDERDWPVAPPGRWLR